MKSKKQNVIEVASQLFSEQGFENTTMAEICRVANVSKGLVYHHFKSKDEILVEIFSFGTKRMIDMNVSESFDSPVDQLINLIETVFDQLKNDRLFFQLNLNIMFQPSTRSLLKNQISERSSMLLASVKKIFDELDIKNSKTLSFMFIAELDGISLDYLSVFEDYPLDELKEHLINKYKNAFT